MLRAVTVQQHAPLPRSGWYLDPISLERRLLNLVSKAQVADEGIGSLGPNFAGVCNAILQASTDIEL